MAVILVPCNSITLNTIFYSSIEFAKKTVASLQPPVGHNGTQLLLVAYGERTQILVDSNRIPNCNVHSVTYAISSAKPIDLGEANITNSLEETSNLFTKAEKRFRNQTKTLCILLSGNSSTVDSDTVTVAEGMKENGTEIFVVRPTGESDSQLTTLVSEPVEEHLSIVAMESDISSASTVVDGNIQKGTKQSVLQFQGLWVTLLLEHDRGYKLASFSS